MRWAFLMGCLVIMLFTGCQDKFGNARMRQHPEQPRKQVTVMDVVCHYLKDELQGMSCRPLDQQLDQPLDSTMQSAFGLPMLADYPAAGMVYGDVLGTQKLLFIVAPDHRVKLLYHEFLLSQSGFQRLKAYLAKPENRMEFLKAQVFPFYNRLMDPVLLQFNGHQCMETPMGAYPVYRLLGQFPYRKSPIPSVYVMFEYPESQTSELHRLVSLNLAGYDPGPYLNPNREAPAGELAYKRLIEQMESFTGEILSYQGALPLKQSHVPDRLLPGDCLQEAGQ